MGHLWWCCVGHSWAIEGDVDTDFVLEPWVCFFFFLSSLPPIRQILAHETDDRANCYFLVQKYHQRAKVFAC